MDIVYFALKNSLIFVAGAVCALLLVMLFSKQKFDPWRELFGSFRDGCYDLQCLAFLLVLQYLLAGASAWIYYGLMPNLGIVDWLRVHLLNFSIPIFIWIFLSVAIKDAAFYWCHRWNHEFKPLWPLHEVHHTPERLSIFANTRQFQTSVLVVNIIFLPLADIFGEVNGGSIELLTVIRFLVTIQNYIIHSPAATDWHWGVFRYLIISPRHHLVHHSLDPRFIGRNYGFIFPWWDMMFGTYVDSNRLDIDKKLGLPVPVSSLKYKYSPIIDFVWVLAEVSYESFKSMIRILKNLGGNKDEIKSQLPMVPKQL